ncbi:MAG: hypothetical protein ACT4OZ_17900 [Gemmatimonadota bacterium]
MTRRSQAAVLLLALGAATAEAQPPARPPQSPQVPAPSADTLRPPISSRRAFLYSLAVPGWGQARLGRPSAAAVYAGFEMIAIAMLQKTRARVHEAERGHRLTRVNSWRVDGTGRPVFDSTGAPIALDSVPSPYVPEDGEEGRGLLKARKLQVEDWITLLIFNHLFSAADAFVAAQLWDLPKRLELRTLPSGERALLVRLTFR